MSSLRRFRLSLLPVLLLSGVAIAAAVNVGCSTSKEDKGLTEDRLTGGGSQGYGYGYDDYGYDDYGYDDYGYGYGH